MAETNLTHPLKRIDDQTIQKSVTSRHPRGAPTEVASCSCRRRKKARNSERPLGRSPSGKPPEQRKRDMKLLRCEGHADLESVINPFLDRPTR